MFTPGVLKVQDVYDYVTRAFGDESGAQITQMDIIRWVNMSLREIVTVNDLIQAVGQTDLVAGQTEYDISALRINSIRSLRVDGSPISHIGFEEFEQYVLKQDTKGVNTGTPNMWTNFTSKIILYPKPDHSTVGGISIYYSGLPPVVGALTDLLGIPDSFFNRICEFVMSQAFLLDEDTQNSQVMQQTFADGLRAQSGSENGKNTSSYPVITILPEDAVDWWTP